MGSIFDDLDNAIGTNFAGNNPNGNLNRLVRGEGLGSIRLPTAGSEEFRNAAITAAEVAAIAAGGYYLYSAYGAAGAAGAAADVGIGAEASTGVGYLGADIGSSVYASQGVGASYLGVEAATLGGGSAAATTGSAAGLGYLGVETSLSAKAVSAGVPWYESLYNGIESTLGLAGTAKALFGGSGGAPGGNPVLLPNPRGSTPTPSSPSVFLPSSGFSTQPGVTTPKGSVSTISAGGISPILLIGIAGALYIAKKKRMI